MKNENENPVTNILDEECERIYTMLEFQGVHKHILREGLKSFMHRLTYSGQDILQKAKPNREDLKNGWGLSEKEKVAFQLTPPAEEINRFSEEFFQELLKEFGLDAKEYWRRHRDLREGRCQFTYLNNVKVKLDTTLGLYLPVWDGNRCHDDICNKPMPGGLGSYGPCNYCMHGIYHADTIPDC